MTVGGASMSRVRGPKTLLAAAASAAVAAALSCRDPGPARPNVLLLVLDTTRADRCSFLESEWSTTPRLAEFARDAAVFEDCWSPSPWTAPAHASLFTGLEPRNHGLRNGGVLHLDDRRTTLAELLRGAGWATACFTNNPWVAPENGLTQGFDTADLRFRDEGRPYPWAPATHEAALAWMEDQSAARRPFFAFVNDMEPHAPYTPPEAFASLHLPASVPAATAQRVRSLAFPQTLGVSLGVVPLDPAERRVLRALYDAEVSALDDAVGSLLDAMRARGLLDGTLVVVTSDHGEGLGDHGWIEHATLLHRELLRVPLLVRKPGTFAGGRRVRDVVRLEDVFPTVLEACGVPVPPGLDGRALQRDLPGRVALGEEGASGEMALVARRHWPGVDTSVLTRNRRSVREGRWHLILTDGSPPLLYDVVADPFETTDLAAGHPAEVGRLTALFPPPRRR